MAMKEQQRQVYRSMQGKEVDMSKLALQNENTVAVGNVRVNARGDELGAGGKIVKKREDVLKEYYQDNKDKINTPYICDICNGRYTHTHRIRHCKSIKHQTALNNND